MIEIEDMKIIISGDTYINEDSCSEGLGINEVFDKDVVELFANADYSLLNLEGPLTVCDTQISKSGPNLKSSPRLANLLKELGVKCTCLANNHIMDYGKGGFYETLNILKLNGFEWLGAGENNCDIKKNIIKDICGCRIGFYNVAETEFNIPTDMCPGCNLFDEHQTFIDIKEMSELCDYVIVLYHGGVEEFRFPTPVVRKRFHNMIDCGADFVVAQHSHCIACEEVYKGRRLLYGQGNFIMSGEINEYTRDGLIIQLSFEDGTIDCKYHLIENDNGKICYSKDQDLTSFYERGRILNDDSLYHQELKKQINKMRGIYLDYLHARNIFDKIVLRFCRRSFYDKYLEYIYKKNNVPTILNTIRDSDHREMITYILEDYMESKEENI